jgi:hypothetical protein
LEYAKGIEELQKVLTGMFTGFKDEDNTFTKQLVRSGLFNRLMSPKDEQEL